jgi:hypothetical protein
VIQGAQIISQPVGDTLCDGTITSLQVVVDSPNLYIFKWYQDNNLLVNNTTHLFGVNTPTLQFIPISTQQSGMQYTCEILNEQCNVGIFTAPASFIVDSFPIVHLSGLNDFYCVYHPSSTLVGTPEGGVFSGNGVTGNQFSPAQAGIGLWPIIYTFSNNNQCIATDTFWVEVEGCDGVNEYKTDDFEIFPNPSTGIFHIKSTIQTEMSIEVYSVLGQKLTSFEKNLNKVFTLDISTYPSGVYLIKITQNEISHFSKVLLKK